MRRRLLWVGEGMLVALAAACAFLAPWVIARLAAAWAPRTRPAAPATQLSLPAPLPVTEAAPVLSPVRMSRPPEPPRKWILVDLLSSPQTLTAYEGKRVAFRFLTSGSRMGTDDVGPCLVSRKLRRAWYAPDRYWMRWWMTIAPQSPKGRARARIRGYNGIHATPASNYRRLGRPASHGCLRLRLQHSEQLWRWASVGTPIYIRKYRDQPASPGALLLASLGR